jgi:AsmA protein
MEVNRIRLTNASLSLEMIPGQTVRLSRLDMELDDLKAGVEMRLNLAGRLAVSSPEMEGALALKARARLPAQKYELRDVTLRFTPDKGILPASAAMDAALHVSYDVIGGKLNLAHLSLAVQGFRLELAGDADAKTQVFSGILKMDGSPRKLAQALGVSLPFNEGLEICKLQSPVAMAGRTLSFHAVQGALDTTTVDGQLSLDMRRKYVAGRLKLGTLNLDALMASVPLPAPDAPAALFGPAEALAAPARVPPNDPQPAPATPGAQSVTPAANSGLPTVEMELACASLTVSKLQFRDIRAKVRGQGVYRIEPLVLNLGTGGTVNLKLGIDASAMRYTAAGKVSNVAVGPLLQAMQGKRPVDGTANLELDNIACAGTSSRAIQADLSGKGLLTVRGIVLNSVSILPGDAPAGIGTPPTHFEQLTAPFTAAGGIVSLAPVTLTSSSANVRGQGVVRLPQENVDFTADVSLQKNTVPIQLSGPYSDLSYGLDGKRALHMPARSPGAPGEAIGQKGGGTLQDAKDALGAKAGDAVQQGMKNALKGDFGR